MVNALYKFLYWFPMILWGLINWQTLFYVCKNWSDYKKHLRFKKLLVIAGTLALIIAVYCSIESLNNRGI